MSRSSFDNVSAYLGRRRTRAAVPAEVKEDVETVVRRCERLRSLGDAFAQVELSPYMKSLLRLSAHDAQRGALVAGTTAAAGS